MACFEVNVNLSLCLIKHRAMNTDDGMEKRHRASLIPAPMELGSQLHTMAALSPG
jgi:hypothetical protein